MADVGLSAASRGRPRPAIPNGVLGMLLFIGVEVMLFAGFISAFTIVKANYAPGSWPPAGQPRLPIEMTAGTTLLLLASGALLFSAGRRFEQGHQRAGALFSGAIALGGAFVTLQGVEWVRLVAEGLTIEQNPYGALFYVIVGAHAAHAIPSWLVMVAFRMRLARGRLDAGSFATARLFWYFVVLVWPVLYWRVYL